MARHQLEQGGETFNLEDAVHGLRDLVAETEAFATTADDLYEDVGNHDDRRQQERVAWIVTRASVAAQAALAAVSKLAGDLVEHRDKLWNEEHASTRNDGSTPGEDRSPPRRRAGRARVEA